MNKPRRKQIEKLVEKINMITDELQDILYDEEYYFDNMPDNLKGSERGETSENAIDIMTDTVDQLGDIVNNLEEVLI